MKVLYVRPRHVGWSSVTRMATLLAHCLEADLQIVEGDATPSRRRLALRRLPRRRGHGGDLIVLAALPADLNVVLRADHFIHGYDRVIGWVIDSFRDDTIPDVARALGHFDHFIVGDAEVAETWRKVTRTPVTWVPFGTDALNAQWDNERDVDLLRIGRQPRAWQDDERSGAAAKQMGIHFAPGPEFGASHEANNRQLDAAMGTARMTLSFSNTSAPSDYTHPTVEYLTARWLDALGHGAVVAGIAPRCEGSRRLLWPEATLELPTTDQTEGLAAIKAGLARWTPAVARLNHRRSLERTDWRWRFQEVLDALVVDTPGTLADELSRLRQRAASLSPDT